MSSDYVFESGVHFRRFFKEMGFNMDKGFYPDPLPECWPKLSGYPLPIGGTITLTTKEVEFRFYEGGMYDSPVMRECRHKIREAFGPRPRERGGHSSLIIEDDTEVLDTAVDSF